MGNTNPADNGHAAQKYGQELGLNNELKLLKCIKNEGWIREAEASLITGLSMHSIGVISRRLANNQSHSRPKKTANTKPPTFKKVNSRIPEIFRTRVAGNAGYFLRLTAAGAERVNGKTGKDINVPKCWPHHAMAIQTLNYLSKEHKYEFETEATIRHRKISGKIPDGQLLSENSIKTHFEQERTRKSGKAMRNQAQSIARMATAGTQCYIAYPYPASICGGIDHEVRLTNAIRQYIGVKSSPIKLIRCHFNSLIEYQNVHISKFECINLSEREKSEPDEGKLIPKTLIYDPLGYHWQYTNDMSHLYYQDKVIVEDVTFTEENEDDEEPACCNFLGESLSANIGEDFAEFTVRAKNIILISERDNITTMHILFTYKNGTA